MKTIFVTAHDTEVGKTWVCRSLARSLSRSGATLQYVKPVSTGSDLGDAVCDASYVAQGIPLCETHTFYDFRAPLAPVQAARAEGVSLSLSDFILRMQKLPRADWRIIESAGGIAVPIDADGNDWIDFLKNISVDYLILVIGNRMGAINQARMLHSYASDLDIEMGFWINYPKTEDSIVGSMSWDVLERSLIESLQTLDTAVWARQGNGSDFPKWINPPAEFTSLMSGGLLCFSAT